jgi:hypothetical protein
VSPLSSFQSEQAKTKKQAKTSQAELLTRSMEGREGIAVAGGHESGHGLFGADVPMTEAQEAAKEYHSSPSSPSTSPTPSPPPAVAGHGEEATATPLGWSLGAGKPSEAAGDSGMQTAGRGEHAASLSSGRRRGRPRGSGRRQILASLGQYAPSVPQASLFSSWTAPNFRFLRFGSLLCLLLLWISLFYCRMYGVQLG